MLTLFAIPKPFHGHFALIQRNAIQSWTRLEPRPQIILFGNEQETAETAREFGVRHVPDVACNEAGTPLINDLFEKAQAQAGDGLLGYVNADIMLMNDFMRAVERGAAWSGPVFMVGRRWDVDLREPWEFSAPGWAERLRATASAANHQRPYNWIDYFVFSQGLGSGLPPLAIGRRGWDNYLLWHARARGAAVLDASEVVMAVHQNHDYSHHPQGEKGVWHGDEARRNRELIGEWWHMHTIEDAAYRLTATGVEPSRRHAWLVVKRAWSHPGSFFRLAGRLFQSRNSVV